MNKKNIKKWMSFAFALLVAVATHAGSVGSDWGKTDGVVIDGGETVTQVDKILASDGGTFVKAGEGKLVLPMDQIDRSLPNRIRVAEGTVAIQNGGQQSVSVQVPDFLAASAAFWVDASADNGTLVLSGSTVTRWCDVRETNVESPTLYNARPADANNAGTDTIDQIYVDNGGCAGTNAVYFGGYNTNNRRYMQFYKGASSIDCIQNIRHAFVVFGAFDSWNGPLGNGKNPDDWFSVAKLQPLSDSPVYIANIYGEAMPGAFSARHYLNGQRFDPWSAKVMKGFQLWETQFCDYTGSAGNFFNQKGSAQRQGGDYLSEVILFTNDLTVVQRLEVQKYLLAKWNLVAQLGEVSIETALGTTVELSTPVGDKTAEALMPRITGAGVVRKVDDGEMTLDDKLGLVKDFDGELDLAGGMLFAHRGTLPIMKLVAGDTVSYAAYNQDGAAMDSVEAYEKYGFRISRTPGGRRGTVVKTGEETIRVNSLPEDVKKLVVADGELAIVEAPVGNLVTNGALSAVIPNGDFEEPFEADTSYNRKALNVTTAVNGWLKEGKQVVAFIAENYSAGDVGTDNPHKRGTICPFPIRQGDSALTIGNNGGAYTQGAVFPRSGFYEMTLLESSRFHRTGGSTPLANPGYDVLIGESWDSASVVATRLIANAGNFNEIKIDLGYVEAGTKAFGFRASSWSTGTTLILDDIRVSYVGAKRDMAYVEIPNGNFEMTTNQSIEISGTANSAMYPDRTNTNEAIGWTFTNEDSVCPAAAVVSAYCSPTLSTSLFSPAYGKELMPFGNLFDGLYGSSHLSLVGTAGSAKTTFSVPAGSYYLSGKISQWGGKINGKDFRAKAPAVSATVSTSNGEIQLGTCVADAHMMQEARWPLAFTLAEEGEISLELKGDSPTGSVLVDDLKLVKVESVDHAYGKELIENGGFEIDGAASTSGWTLFDATFGTKAVFNAVNPQTDKPENQTPAQFGQTPYEGIAYARIYNDSGAYQTLHLAKGVYRFAFATHSRSTPGYGKQPIRVWLGDAAGNEVQTIGIAQVEGVADVGHVWYFRVEESGDYRVYIQGTDYWKAQCEIDNKNHCSVLDGVSLCRVRDEMRMPEVSPELDVQVRENAKLRLDFSGLISVGRVRLGSTVLSGGAEVNSQNYPEYVVGEGTLVPTGAGCQGLLIIMQ